MAGIGFRLQKLITGDSYTDILKAYLFSAVIAAGPMLAVMITLAVVKRMAQATMGLEGETQFMALVVYVYAFSMVLTSPFYFVVTRYLADQYYLRDLRCFTPTYFGVISLVMMLALAVVCPWVLRLPVSFATAFWEIVLFVSVSCTWIAMLFLSAARSYMGIVAAYVAGCAAGIIFSVILGRRFGLSGFLGGFAAGQFLTWLILSLRIIVEFGGKAACHFAFLKYFRRLPMMLAVGILYYVGIWVDKFVFWSSPHAMIVLDHIRITPDYDTPLFVAYLTVVPSLAFFLIQMETTFAAQYHAYYTSVCRHKPLGAIRNLEQQMADTLSNQFQRFSVFQGIISGMAIVMAPQIADLFGLNSGQIGVFRIGILGAFMQITVIMVINILFYFDAQREVTVLTFLFAICNAVFAYASIRIGLPAFGYGYTLASFVTLIAGFFILDRRLKTLGYWTFMRQPVVIPKFKFETDWKKRVS